MLSDTTVYRQVDQRMVELFRAVIHQLPSLQLVEQFSTKCGPADQFPCIALRGQAIDLKVAVTWMIQDAARSMLDEPADGSRYVRFQMLTERLLISQGLSTSQPGITIAYWPGLKAIN